ncbi:hypothetical protein [Desertivirga arenae]|uniref:hypothetical protein n=1 Tax=Desertivirga arenae TaxID=2810309 RepID=UPI001A967F2F|nr:hypothetical protein [Pedobacter sp. SYSU D00823]
MKSLKVLAVANTIFYVAANVISYLSNTGIFGGRTIGDVSDKYKALFVPAGFTFAIWGVIYASLYAFVIYHLVKAFKAGGEHEANKDLIKLNWLFVLNNIATAAWVVVWVNEGLILSVVLMLIQLVTLILMNVRLHIYNPHRSLASRAFTQFPLAIYFGWICIATIANISSSLVGLGWDGGTISPQTWTIFLIAVATLISLFIILGTKDVFFGMVVIWALFGIISKRKLEGADSYAMIIFSAQIAIALIALAVVIQLARNFKAPHYSLDRNV